LGVMMMKSAFLLQNTSPSLNTSTTLSNTPMPCQQTQHSPILLQTFDRRVWQSGRHQAQSLCSSIPGRSGLWLVCGLILLPAQ
jgi:hypothetical protein